MYEMLSIVVSFILGITPSFGNGPGTINQLSPFRVSGGRVELSSTTAGFRIPSLASLDCIGTDADGDFGAGTCTGGEGSSFAYLFPSDATSTALNFTGGLSLNSWKTSTSTIVCKESAFCQYTTIQSAIDAGWTSIFVKNGVYSEQINLSAAKTQIVGESLNAIIQCNGITQSPCVTADTDEFKIANLTIRETNGVWSGTGIDFSNTALGLIDGVRINNFATSTRAVDSTSNTFYNKIQNSTFFNPKTCIELSGSQANANWSAWNRCRPAQVSGTGFGVYLSDVRGFTSVADDFEGTTTSNGVTGIYVDATSREISFTNPWVEANQTGINIASGANRVTFTGGSITSNGTDITDNGTNTIFINTSDTGVLVNKFGYASTTALNVGSDFVADLDGAGLTLSAAGVLSATLGTAIDISGETNLTGGLGLTLTDDDMACDTATGAVFGCLSAADFTTFNNKVSSTSIDTVGELQTLVGGQNILLETEIDACSELLALLDDETGTCGGAVFSVGPTLTGVTTMANASTTLFSTSYASSTQWNGGGLTDCDTAATSKLLWDATTMRFSCGTDQNSGGGGGGSVATSTSETSGYVAYWSSTSATPATLGSDSGLLYDDASDILDINTLRLLNETVRTKNSTGDNAGGALNILAGSGDSSSGNADGGILSLFGGDGAATSGNGGNIVITAGSAIGTGSNGRIVLSSNASSTLFSANYASSTSLFAGTLTIPNLTSALLLTNGSGVLAEYAGSSCTNQSVTAISALGVATCTTINGSYLDLTANYAWTGTHDFGGGVLEIPNGSNPTVDAIGETALDTTANEFLFATSTSNDPAVIKPWIEKGFTFGTSTQGSGTTTKAWYIPSAAGYVDQIVCHTNSFMRVLIKDEAGNRMNDLVASSTEGVVKLSTNNAFTAYEPLLADIGTTTNIAANVYGVCTARIYFTRN
jgi:hypothetical protein